MIQLEDPTFSLTDTLKKNVFSIQRELMRSKVQLPLLVMLLVALIEFYFSSSIFFIEDIFEPNIVNRFLRYPLLTDLQHQFEISRRAFIIVLLMYQIALLGLYWIIWIKSDQEHNIKILGKIFNCLFVFYRMNIVMIIYLVVQINKIIFFGSGPTKYFSTPTQTYSSDESLHKDPATLFIVIFINTLNFILFSISVHFIYLNIYPLRKGNKSWNFDNRYEFYNFLFNCLRIVVIAMDGFSTFFVIISFALQIFLCFYCTTQKAFTAEINILRNFKNNLGCALHISLLTNLVTKNKVLSFQLLILTFALTFIKVLLDYLWYCQRSLHFPLCDSKVYEFYNFYFALEETSQKGNTQNESFRFSQKNEYQQVFDIHQANCRQKNCILKSCKRDKLNDLQYCQKLVDKILEQHRFQSPENQIMAQFWKLQIQSKNTIQIFQLVKAKSIELQFMLEAVTELLKDILAKNQTNKKNQLLKRKRFYEELDSTIQSFSKFYAQVGKSTPEFETIVEEGYNCKKKANKLKWMYNQILKSKSMNFRMLEVYLEFQVKFDSSNVLSDNLLQKVAYLQKNQTENYSIDEMYLPTINVSSVTGIIEDFNMQASNFFKYTKFELKLKPISQIFYTNIDAKYFNQITQKALKGENLKAMIRKKNGQCVCAKLNFTQRTLESKKICMISFEQEKLFQNKNIFLIDSCFDLLMSIRKQTHFRNPVSSDRASARSKGFTILIDWEQIFEKYIKSQRQDLLSKRILKLRISDLYNILLIVSLQDTICQQNYLLTVTIVAEVLQNRQNRFSLKNKELSGRISKIRNQIFKFYYTDLEPPADVFQPTILGRQQDQQQAYSQSSLKECDQKDSDESSQEITSNRKFSNLKVMLTGEIIDMKKPEISKYFSSTRNLESELLIKNINLIIVKKTIMNTDNYVQGIKTYRLWQNELYNIDLEDRNAYINRLDQQSPMMLSTQNEKKNQIRFVTVYKFVAVTLLVVILSTVVFLLIEQSIVDFQEIKQSYRKEFIMQSILLSYNKINAILRDVKNGLYTKFQENWQSDVFTSLNNIKSKRMLELDLFRDLNLSLQHNSMIYQGNFNDLLDLYLSQVSTLARTGLNVTQISQIHDMALDYISKYFKSERIYHFNRMSALSKTINQTLVRVFYFSLALIILIELVLIKLFHCVFTKLKQKLNFILLTSDYEAKVKYENCEKLRYAIQMVQKNFDIDLKMMLINKTHFHKRKKPKNPKLNPRKKYVKIILMILYFAIHIVYVNISNINASNNIRAVDKMFNLGKQLMGSYTDIVQISTQVAIKGHYDPQELIEMKNNLSQLEASRGSTPFGTVADDLIQILMYENVCTDKTLSKAFFLNEKTSCEKALPKFQVENPYSLGCINYIRRLQYKLVDNITQTYGATGVYATSFAQLYNRLSQIMLSEGQMRIEEYIQEQSDENTILVFLSFFYVIIGAYLLWTERQNVSKIREIIDFFKSGEQKRLFQDHTLKNKKEKVPSAKIPKRYSIQAEMNSHHGHSNLQSGQKRNIRIPCHLQTQFDEENREKGFIAKINQSTDNKEMQHNLKISRFGRKVPQNKNYQ